MIPMQHAFSIESKLVPGSEQPFGPKYGGTFTVRRPSLADRRAIALKDSATLSMYGPANPDTIGHGIKLLSYITIFVAHVAEEPLPKWFDLSKLYSEKDEESILAVWEEVEAFLATFRSAEAAGNSGEPTGEPAAVVSEKV